MAALLTTLMAAVSGCAMNRWRDVAQGYVQHKAVTVTLYREAF